MGLPNHRPARLRHAQGQIYASPPRTARPRFPAVAAALAQVSSGAAVDLTPRWLQTIVGLNGYDLNAWEAAVVRQIGAFADRLVLETNPAVQACRRMRLSANYLYVHDNVL